MADAVKCVRLNQLIIAFVSGWRASMSLLMGKNCNKTLVNTFLLVELKAKTEEDLALLFYSYGRRS